MDVNTICLEKADYDAMVREQYALGRQIDELDVELKSCRAKIKAVEDLLLEVAKSHISKKDRLFRYSNVSCDEVAEAIGADFQSLISYVETMIREDMEGYQE